MSWRVRALLLPLFVLLACAARQDADSIKGRVYDADFELVFEAAIEATAAKYPTEPNRGRRIIQTAWKQVSADTMMPARATPQAGIRPTRSASDRFFVRFEVEFVGPRPWSVRVHGHAARWRPGDGNRPASLPAIAAWPPSSSLTSSA